VNLLSQHPGQANQSDAGDDYSRNFHRIRGSLRDSSGRTYAEFVGNLRPNYLRVWFDIFSGYFALILTLAALVSVNGPLFLKFLACGAASISVGYWIAYLQLFMHEAAHYNLAKNRPRNDLLANLFVCAIGAQEVSRYRSIHFQHHRALGTTADTENSYLNALTFRFLAEVLFGIRSFRVFRHRNQTVQKEGTRSYLSPWLIETILIHAGIILGAVYLARIELAVSWLAGWLLAFPFWGTLRNILEHRSEAIVGEIDDFCEDHGPFTRIFGNDPISSTFGGAGFNRHLLHHWEPQVSYTRLPDLEIFLMHTAMRNVVNARRSSYYRCFVTLLKRAATRA